MAILGEDNLKHGGSRSMVSKPTAVPVPTTTTASTATLAGSLTTLALGPMELGTLLGATPSSKRDFG